MLHLVESRTFGERSHRSADDRCSRRTVPLQERERTPVRSRSLPFLVPKRTSTTRSGTSAPGRIYPFAESSGNARVVEAACRLLPKYPDFTAVVVGFVSVDNRLFVEGLKQRIAAAGLSDRIRFLGELPIEEAPLCYQRISIYVFASRVEGFGLTMLEAMAAQTVGGRGGALSGSPVRGRRQQALERGRDLVAQHRDATVSL
ncbi:MAG: glycosyltransferase [Hyphomicrobiales bacterium]|nr:glycosyltransferase [Hyphomicrobiales bacterium]